MIGEQAEGEIGGKLLCARFANFLLVMRALMTRVGRRCSNNPHARYVLLVRSTEAARRCNRGFLLQLLRLVSKRKARLGADFCSRGSRAVAGVVACFDDPCLFSVWCFSFGSEAEAEYI